eukprot:TRINITY_DN1221_c3_g1_i2.p1 TRINITY_DN1221_c3_g1~~TRINITY_DN1221_c3_g1_i2.p1  ORF type:complete len:799 (+),score=187.50 TRINITY_DN1221_c3_g1_i2:157-2553(+)
MRGSLITNSESNGTASSDTTTINGCMHFAVFGLCNSMYPTFNACARNIARMLSRFGGREVHKLGEGDELEGQQLAFNEWRDSLMRVLSCDILGMGETAEAAEAEPLEDAGKSNSKDGVLPQNSSLRRHQVFGFDESKSGSGISTRIDARSSVELSHLRLTPVDSQLAEKQRKLKAETESKNSSLHSLDWPFVATVTANTALIQSSDRSTHHVVLDVSGYVKNPKQPFYGEGDHVAILAENHPQQVQRLLDRLGLTREDAKTYYTASSTSTQGSEDSDAGDVPHFLSVPRTPTEILRYYIDITTPPTPIMLSVYARYTANDKHFKYLTRLSEDVQAYNEWVKREYPSVLATLLTFDSVKMPFAIFVQETPTMKQRFYSVSSSPSVHPLEMHLTVATVRFTTEDGTLHHGLCSNFLGSMDMSLPKQQRTVRMWIKPAPQFHLPTDHKQPIIMVGPGTGVAPFRGFWQASTGHRTAVLFFGCRSPADHLYEREMSDALERKRLTQVFIAYSRVQHDKKTYVQDRLRQQGKLVFRILHREEGRIYVCGDLNMALGVEDVVKEIAQRQGKMTFAAAQQWVDKLKAKGRYSTDVFGVVLHHKEAQERQMTLVAQKPTVSLLAGLRASPLSTEPSLLLAPLPQPLLQAQRSNNRPGEEDSRSLKSKRGSPVIHPRHTHDHHHHTNHPDDEQERLKSPRELPSNLSRISKASQAQQQQQQHQQPQHQQQQQQHQQQQQQQQHQQQQPQQRNADPSLSEPSDADSTNDTGAQFIAFITNSRAAESTDDKHASSKRLARASRFLFGST